MNYVWHMRLSYTWCTSPCFLLLLLLFRRLLLLLLLIFLTFDLFFTLFLSACVCRSLFNNNKTYCSECTATTCITWPIRTLYDAFSLYVVDVPKSTKSIWYNWAIFFVSNHQNSHEQIDTEFETKHTRKMINAGAMDRRMSGICCNFATEFGSIELLTEFWDKILNRKQTKNNQQTTSSIE